MDKKGFELSINFIIVMILMIVVIGFGLSIFTKIFQESQQIIDTVDTSTERTINRLLDSGELVAIPRDVREAEPGDSVIFYIGIINELAGQDFIVNIEEPALAFDSNHLIYNTNSFRVEHNEKEIVPVKVVVPGGVSGSNIFKIHVCYDDGNPDNNEAVCNPMTDRYYLQKNFILNVR